MLKNDKETLPLAGTLRRLAVIGRWRMRRPRCAVLVGRGGCGRACQRRGGFACNTLGIPGGACAGRCNRERGCVGHCSGSRCVRDGRRHPAGVGEAADMSGRPRAVRIWIFPEAASIRRGGVRARAAPGETVIVVLFSGRPLVVPWLVEQADALLAAWF